MVQVSQDIIISTEMEKLIWHIVNLIITLVMIIFWMVFEKITSHMLLMVIMKILFMWIVILMKHQVSVKKIVHLKIFLLLKIKLYIFSKFLPGKGFTIFSHVKKDFAENDAFHLSYDIAMDNIKALMQKSGECVQRILVIYLLSVSTHI